MTRPSWWTKKDGMYKYGCRCRIFYLVNKWKKQNRVLVSIILGNISEFYEIGIRIPGW